MGSVTSRICGTERDKVGQKERARVPEEFANVLFILHGIEIHSRHSL